MKQRRGQAGDTLVEVVMAVAIISGTLVSAYAVANNSYRLGVQSRERIEAANLAQQQAELLRTYRDVKIAANPEPTGPNVLPNGGSSFRMLPTSPTLTTASCPVYPSGCPAGPSNRYNVSIASVPSGPDISGTGPGAEGRRYQIRVTWIRIGGDATDEPEETEVVLTLVDRRLDKSSLNCDEVEQCS